MFLINKHNTINTDDTYNITKINNIYNVADNQYFIRKTSIQVISPTTLQDITITIMNIM